MDLSLTGDSCVPHLSAYEVARNIRKRSLHDAVERDLLARGFSEAASLRPLFSAEAIPVERSNELPKARTQRPRKVQLVGGEILLRRTPRLRNLRKQSAVEDAVATPSRTKSDERFCTWPGKEEKKKMSKKTGGSKRRKPESSNANMAAEDVELGGRSPSPHRSEDNRRRASPEHRPRMSDDAANDLQISNRSRVSEGPRRPSESGYRIHPADGRRGPDWGQDFRMNYGQSSAAVYPSSFRRPWSPVPYGASQHYDGRGMEYGGRMNHYDAHRPFEDRRGVDFYVDEQRADFDRHGRQYEDRRRVEEGRSGEHPEKYAFLVDGTPAKQQAPSSRGGNSSGPSSSTVLEMEGRLEPTIKARRPLYLDKTGTPVGKMASLFHGDIVSFVKDLDPNVGWEKQTSGAKERLVQRLMNDYDFYGESTVLSEKYVRKSAGGALINFRYAMNQLIDKGVDRPEDLSKEYWEALKKKRESKESQEKSEQMATIARGRASRHTTKKAVADAMLLQLAADLKREPYAAEIDAAVEKEWARVQEEAAQRRRLTSARKANTAATEATADLSHRVELLELFFSTWEPQLELWKRQKFTEVQEPLSNRCPQQIESSHQVPPLLIGNATDTMKETDDGRTVQGSPDNDPTDNSKSSGDEGEESDSEEEESESEEEDSDSDSGKMTVMNAFPIGVVEPSGGTVRNSSIGNWTSSRGNTVVPEAKAASKSAIEEARSASTRDTDEKERTVVPTVELNRKGKEENVIAVEKDSSAPPPKRKKLATNTEEQPLILDDENSVQEGRKSQGKRKISKSTRKHVKAADAKVPKKAGKKGK